LQKDTKIEFDLLYDPMGWIVMDNRRERLGQGTLYIHQGGLLGNVTMLQRYKKKFVGDKN